MINSDSLTFICLLVLVQLGSSAASQIETSSIVNLNDSVEESVCFSSECVLVASRLRSWMDASIDPCENFYKYACGGFLADTCLNESEVKVTPFTMLNEHIGHQLVKVLEEPTGDDEQLAPFRLFKDAFNKCNSDEGERRQW